MFACRLGRDLGLTLDQVFEISVEEFQTWAAFYKIEHDEIRKANQRSR